MNYTILAGVLCLIFIISYDPRSGTLDGLFVDAPEHQKKNNIHY